MTKHSLRGLFLGLSLVLLLSGGVALAQQTVSVEPYCAVCCDLTTTDFLDCFDQSPTYWLVRATGWEPFEKLRFTLTFPGYEHWMAITTAADSTGYYEGHLTFLCSDSQGPSPLAYYYGFGLAWSEDGLYGEWQLRATGEGTGEAVTHLYFAEEPADCLVEEEFVSEPGSILLLGSGLAGLAGYAALRLRSAHPLPWRPRQ